MVSPRLISGLMLLSSAGYAQQGDGLAARRLYYQDNAPEVVFKSTTVAKKAAPAPKVPPAGASKEQRLEAVQQALRAASTTAALKPTANLGIRYNVLRVDVAKGVRTEVSADTVFHEKDCVAVRIQPNRGGFVYVFNQGTSGQWSTLIPSPETEDYLSAVQPYTLLEVPRKNCFEMDNKPGTERLLIVVTDKPEDVIRLNDSLSHPGAVASAELQSFTSGLQGRDLKITRVGNKPAAGEAPYSTYLVNAAATTSDRLVLEIKLKHEK